MVLQMLNEQQNNVIKVHTDTYTTLSYDILYNFLFLYNFEYAVNTSKKMLRNLRVAKPVREPNGEVIWEIKKHNDRNYKIISHDYNKSSYAKTYNGDQQKIRSWVAQRLKETVLTIIRENNLRLKRNNIKEKIELLSPEEIWKTCIEMTFNDFTVLKEYIKNKHIIENITIADIKCLYDKLVGKKSFDKTYSSEQIDRIVGVERDPITTESEIIKRQELNRLEQEYLAKIQSIKDKTDELIREFNDATVAVSEELKEKAKVEYETAVKTINNELNLSIT